MAVRAGWPVDWQTDLSVHFGQQANVGNNFNTHGVNFTNILQASFVHADPKSAKKEVKLSSFLHFWDLFA